MHKAHYFVISKSFCGSFTENFCLKCIQKVFFTSMTSWFLSECLIRNFNLKPENASCQSSERKNSAWTIPWKRPLSILNYHWWLDLKSWSWGLKTKRYIFCLIFYLYNSKLSLLTSIYFKMSSYNNRNKVLYC